jgi:TRAP-type C4-dicarboxylate transport system substrate-binding protein
MKFATLTINDIQHEYIKMYKAELEKATNGRIQVEIFPAGQLGGAPRQTEGLRLGTIEAAMGPAELFVGADQRMQVLAMGGLFKNMEHANKVVNNATARQALFDMSAQRGMIGIGINVYDMQGFVSKQPITKLADFSGKRIRVLAAENEQASVAALGGAPVPMSLPEVLPALQQGTIDGVNSVLGVFAAFRYYDVAPNLVETALWALVSPAFVSKAWFDKLPPDLQAAVRDTGKKIEADVHKWQLARIASDKKLWVEKGGRIVQLSPTDQAEAEKRVNEAIQKVIVKTAPVKEFYDKIKSVATSVN